MKTGGGRGDRVVGGRNNGGAGGFQQGWAWVGQKKERASRHKTGATSRR